MTREAKRELALAYNETVRLHEASYNKTSDTYGLSWDSAARGACLDKDLVPLVYAMAASGYADYAEWALQYD